MAVWLRRWRKGQDVAGPAFMMNIKIPPTSVPNAAVVERPSALSDGPRQPAPARSSRSAPMR